MAAEQAPAKRPHLLLAQHVMTEVLEGMKDTVSSEGLDPTVLKELETVRLRHDAFISRHASAHATRLRLSPRPAALEDDRTDRRGQQPSYGGRLF